jgi:hypothetical protein
MIKKLLFVSIFFIYSNAYGYHSIGLLVNNSQNSYLKKSNGLGLHYNYSIEPFKNNKISLQTSLQLSAFGSRKLNSSIFDTNGDESIVDIKSIEKLFSLSFGPRIKVKDNFYFGISLTHNSFYEKLRASFKWSDTSIGECNDYEFLEDPSNCISGSILGLIFDAGFNVAKGILGEAYSEINGFTSSNNRYFGYKIHFGIIDYRDFTIEMSYNSMPSLKRILTSNENGYLLDYVSSDYFSINFSLALK